MHLFERLSASVVLVISALLADASAQVPVVAGSGSFASQPPYYKAKTEAGGPGFNATAMLTRILYVDELPSTADGAIEVPGRPIPTNDWWTDIINNQFSGALWSYPAMLRTSQEGVQLHRPSYWADAGKEMKSRSYLLVGGVRFRADAAIAADWHDWDVVIRMPMSDGASQMTVTAVHGTPFTWFEYKDIVPEITLSGEGTLFGTAPGRVGIKIGDDIYGVYFAEAAQPTFASGKLRFDGATSWVSVAPLRSEADLTAFAPYAANVPRDTRVEWSYNEATARVNTLWQVDAENLRDGSTHAPVMQGFLPHAYKYATTGAALNFADPDGYATPRGQMKLAVSPTGSFSYSYQFSGMLPIYGAPAEGDDAGHGFSAEVMDRLMQDYASKGSFGGDTYWGGKGLIQMAMNMSFAKQTGNTAVYDESKRRLRDAFVDWLTYTPGEDTFFFSYYPRWGAMLGFDVSYDSDAFNDHHFHYGYFTYAAALLCMEDKDFADEYGELLTMIAKDYANWNRDDKRFPFMRTLDPWCGHSWAGGLGDHGNDNGNGQESTSEAMQSWGGLYLLGVALGNNAMRDAGLWGWNTEARATREYWYDIDSPRPANDGGRRPWPGKGDRHGNYDYNQYPYAYNSNITGKGIGWWTWFGGDPLFMHGIQWMPVSPALDYLSWDADFVGWAYDDMMSGANSAYSHSWFETRYNRDNGDPIEPLAKNDWGNVALAYMQRNNPSEAAAIFDEALQRNMHIATSISTSHISYYVIHNHLTYGNPVFNIHADIPTAQVCQKDGNYTYFVYNPDEIDRKVTFYDDSGAAVRTVTAPARRLAGITADPVATAIEASVDGGLLVPPAATATYTARVIDQYGAGMPDIKVEVSVSDGAPATVSDSRLTVNADAPRDTQFDIIFTAADITETLTVTVNDPIRARLSSVTGVTEICEKNLPLYPSLDIIDQYDTQSQAADAVWTVTDTDGTVTAVRPGFSLSHAGRYVVSGSSAQTGASASTSLFVTPPMPLVSLGCEAMASSAENVGTMPAGACDGNNNVRWGSAHTDNEWIVVDLGQQCYVSRIDILWEAAYASRYELQLAPEGCAMHDVEVVYAGNRRTVTVPLESEWTSTLIQTASGAGHRESVINASGRYVRMRGVERGSNYGYSFYEMSVYGLQSSTHPDAVIGIDFELPQVAVRDEVLSLVPEAYTMSGDIVSNINVTWSADKAADFDGNDFTPRADGVYTLTATLEGVGGSSASVFVNDIERPVRINVDRDSYTAIENDPIVIPFSIMNQFLAPYSRGNDGVDIRVLDADENPATSATYHTPTATFTATQTGDYTVDFGGMARVAVSVRPISEVNLALGKTAWDSSHENDGLRAMYAVDGKLNTRWGSTFHDNEWMTVDLGKVYSLDHIKIYWNNPAYATHYTVDGAVSDDDDAFETLAAVSNYRRTDDPVVLKVDSPKARYIRVTGLKRSTGYGTSIDELEVYGNGVMSGVENVTDGSAEIVRIEYFAIDGCRLMAPAPGRICIRRTVYADGTTATDKLIP